MKTEKCHRKISIMTLQIKDPRVALTTEGVTD